MAASTLLILATLAARRLAVLAQKDCPVVVTGPEQQWTAARQLEWIPTATSTSRQFPGRPPGRSELSFSVLSSLSVLEIHLSSSRHPGGFLLHLDPGSWRAQRTVVGAAVGDDLSTGGPSPDQVTAADQWSSYAVSVSRPDTVQLQRLYDNSSWELWLEMHHPEVLLVDSASVRVTPPISQNVTLGLGRGPGPHASGNWGFWKFDCSTFYYQSAKLCHLWPSWPSDVPLRFRTLHQRFNPTTSIIVHLNATGTAELYLFETSELFYLVTLSPTELTLGRTERGVPVARPVARACLTSPTSPSPFRLLWVSILGGFISAGLEGAQPCGEQIMATTDTPTADPASEGKAEEGDSISGPEEVTNSTTEVTNSTTDVTGLTEVTTAATTTPAPVRTRVALITWQDGRHYHVASYGIRTPDGPGIWTVDCLPRSASASDTDEDDPGERPTPRVFIPIADDPSADPDASEPGSGPDYRGQQPFLLATVVLAVASMVLLLVCVLLITALVSQRRRRSAELAAERRLSLGSTDVFRAPPAAIGDGEHEYAELHLYDRVRPMSVQPGESTFKPIRRQPTRVEPPETKPQMFKEEKQVVKEPVPVFEGTVPVFEGTVPAIEGTAPVVERMVEGMESVLKGAIPEVERTTPEVGMESDAAALEMACEGRGTPDSQETSVEPLPPPPENI